MCKQSIDRFNEDRARLPSWGPEIDRDVSIYVDGLANWIVGSLHWSFETERYFGKSGHQVKATRTVEILPLRAWIMSKLSLQVCSFSYFLDEIAEKYSQDSSLHIFIFLNMPTYAPSNMLLQTFSHDHYAFQPLFFYLTSRFCLFRWSAHCIWSFVCYLLGLRRQTNPLYTSTTLLDNHHCCAWLFISTLVLCLFVFFGLCFHILLRIDLPVCHYYTGFI